MNRIWDHSSTARGTLENAKLVADIEAKEGGFGHFLASWPADDQLGLMTELHKRGSRLGGATGAYFLRFAGWDAWIASSHVCAALVVSAYII